MKEKYNFKDFTDIIRTLRSENGCPWDKEQTHNSLKPCMMEEAAELLGAIRIYSQTGNAENMQLPSPELLTFYRDFDKRVLWIDSQINDYSLEYAKYIIFFF